MERESGSSFYPDNSKAPFYSLVLSQDNLLTVLEVLVHDPLCDWSVGLSKAAAKQAEKGLEQLLKKEDEQRNRLDKDVNIL